jgi:hypothetical protein
MMETGNPKTNIVHHDDGFKNTVITPLGKTLRDEFAMAALTGLLADPGDDPTANRAASDAYRMADAMMAERQKGGAA